MEWLLADAGEIELKCVVNVDLRLERMAVGDDASFGCLSLGLGEVLNDKVRGGGNRLFGLLVRCDRLGV